MKKNEKKDNFTLSRSDLAYLRQLLFQRQVSDFMKALFFLDHRKWVDELVIDKIHVIMFLIRTI